MVCLCGCGHDWVDIGSSASRDTSPSTADVPELAQDETSFAFDLYRAQVGADATSNVFYSPYSVSVALAMTFAGAGGATADQIAASMHFTLPPARLHAAFDAVDLALANRPGIELHVANSIWGQSSLSFGQPFLDTLAVDYGSEVRGVDFMHDATQATAAIDGWTADQTNGKIANLFPPGSLDASTRVVLVNAIYFRGDWQTKFDATQTAPGSFTKLDGSVVSAPLMHADQATFPVAVTPMYTAIDLPYDGAQTAMLVVMPNGGEFAAAEASLGVELWGQVNGSLHDSLVSLTMPKFEIRGASVSLMPALEMLGMTDAFDAQRADFSPMVTSEPIALQDVVHQAYVHVDENGTEAAAATGVSGGDNAVFEPMPITINRPFFVFIHDLPTGALLFVGRVMDPTL